MWFFWNFNNLCFFFGLKKPPRRSTAEGSHRAKRVKNLRTGITSEWGDWQRGSGRWHLQNEKERLCGAWVTRPRQQGRVWKLKHITGRPRQFRSDVKTRRDTPAISWIQVSGVTEWPFCILRAKKLLFDPFTAIKTNSCQMDSKCY